MGLILSCSLNLTHFIRSIFPYTRPPPAPPPPASIRILPVSFWLHDCGKPHPFPLIDPDPTTRVDLDPDPQPLRSAQSSIYLKLSVFCRSGTALTLVGWIRIREDKNDPQNLKKMEEYLMFWSAGCSLLRAEGFSCSLDFLQGDLGINKLNFFGEKKLNFFQLY